MHCLRIVSLGFKRLRWATWLPVALLHPNVAVVLSHAGLGVEEGHADAALGTQAGIVATAVLYGLPVELVAEPGEQTEQSEEVGKKWLRRKDRRRRSPAAIGCNSFLRMHKRAFFSCRLGLAALSAFCSLCMNLLLLPCLLMIQQKQILFNPFGGVHDS